MNPDDLELHDDEIPEYFPHLRANRAERYNKARSLLQGYVDRETSFRETWIEIIELPEISTNYGD